MSFSCNSVEPLTKCTVIADRGSLASLLCSTATATILHHSWSAPSASFWIIFHSWADCLVWVSHSCSFVLFPQKGSWGVMQSAKKGAETAGQRTVQRDSDTVSLLQQVYGKRDREPRSGVRFSSTGVLGGLPMSSKYESPQ